MNEQTPIAKSQVKRSRRRVSHGERRYAVWLSGWSEEMPYGKFLRTVWRRGMRVWRGEG